MTDPNPALAEERDYDFPSCCSLKTKLFVMLAISRLDLFKRHSEYIGVFYHIQNVCPVDLDMFLVPDPKAFKVQDCFASLLLLVAARK